MGLRNSFKNRKVFLDTSPFIYFIEGRSPYQSKLVELFTANRNGEISFLTSTLTLLEVLVRPIRMKRLDIAAQYEQIMVNSDTMDIWDMDIEVSRKAAKLRASHNLKSPDAIQLATTIVKGADFFLTNDKELKRVSEIRVILLNEL